MNRITGTQLKILKNFNWLFGAYIYRFLIGFVTLAYVTRYLGPEKYGTLSYSLSVYTFAELLLYLVNQEIVKKDFIENQHDRNSIIKTVFIFQSAMSIGLLILCNSIVWGLDVETGQRRVLISIFSLCILLKPVDILTHLFSSQMRNDLISRAEVGVVTIFNITRAILVFLKVNLFMFSWAMVFQKIIHVLLTTYIYFRTFDSKLGQASFDLVLLKRILKASIPLFMATTASIIFTRIDQVMLGNLLSNEAVGIYSVVVKLSEPWIFIAAILTQSVYPVLVKTYEKSVSEFSMKIRKTLCILFYTALGIILGTYLSADFIIEFIFSNKFSDSISILKVHIFYVIFVFWIHVTNQYDVIVGATKITLIKTVLASILNIGLNYYLIQKVGVIGASYATICSYIFSAFAVNLFFKQTRPLFILQLKSVLFWRLKWIY